MDTLIATESANQTTIRVEHAWSIPPLATCSKRAAAGHESAASQSLFRGRLSRCPQPIGARKPRPCNLHNSGGVQYLSRA